MKINGNKIAEDKKNYDVDKNILTITNETKGIWSSNVNKYKIIYEYDETDFTAQNITLNTKVNTEMYVQGARIIYQMWNLKSIPFLKLFYFF